MPGIDENRKFFPLHIAVLTVSDTRTEKTDKSGDLLAKMLDEAGHVLASRAVVRDDIPEIQAKIKGWIEDPKVEVVITTGGTGFTGRDVTVEAVKPFYDKEIDGFSTIMHMISYETVGTSTVQSRACGGLAKDTLLFSIPGSPGACRDAWNGILKLQLDSRHRPCNFVELMPRFLEHL